MTKTVLALIALGLLSTSLFAKSAETLLQENKCMNCHNIIGMKSAPPFSGIAGKAVAAALRL